MLTLSGALVLSTLLLYPSGYVCTAERFAYCKDPSELGLVFEDVEYQTADGVRISAWWIPGSFVGTSTVILVHGRGVDRHEGMRYAAPLHAAGFSLLLPDLRGCGKSQHSISSMSYYERRDVLASVDYAAKRGSKAMGVFGFSMGGASSIHAMAEDTRIRAGAFEGSFADFGDIAADALWEDYKLPRYPLLPVATAMFEARGSLSIEQIHPEAAIARISPRPVFILHGSADKRVPLRHGERLFAAAGDPKWYWIAPGGRHTAAWQADRAKAESLVAEFFLKYLGALP